jgi:cobalt-zinc-cadmium efflux system outer membrane protein
VGQLRAESSARLRQAGLRPNPELEFEVEEVGSDEWSGPDDSEVTLQVGQLLETGGKRAHRRAVAAAGVHVAGATVESALADLMAQVGRLFYRTLAAQRRVTLLSESHSLADELFESVSQLVSAGKVSPVQLSKAAVERARRAVSLERARAELDTARRDLASTWGVSEPSFAEVSGDLAVTTSLPALDELLGRLGHNPDLAVIAGERDTAGAELDLAHAEGAPDVTVAAGIRRNGAGDDTSFLFVLSVPLPLFDRNQGGIAEAKAALTRRRLEEEAARLGLEVAAASEYRRLQQAFQAVATLRDEVLPAAESAFRAARDAYTLGKEGYLDLLDAQQTLFETQMELVDGMLDYHRSRCDLMRLIGAVPGTGEDSL